MPDREKVKKELLELNEEAYGMWVHNQKNKFLAQIGNVTDDVLALLKEQEAVEPKTGHWIFESAYCEAWSHTCSECGKRMTTAYNTYANYCWNCGAKMEGW